MTSSQKINDAINQLDYLLESAHESGYENLDDWFLDYPDLFNSKAEKYRENNPDKELNFI